MKEIASLLDIDEDKLIHDCHDKRLNGGNRDCVVKKLRRAVESGHIEVGVRAVDRIVADPTATI
jgi:hypothetical protein